MGSFIGNYLAIAQVMPEHLNFWLGHQGYEYVDLGRLWQIGKFAGIVFWLVLMIRGIARRKLLEANEVVGELGFSLGGDPLVASFVGGRIIESPRGGAAVEWVDQFGDTVKVSQRWSNGKLVQRIFDANGSRTNVYRFGDDGRMTMSVTIEAAQLPKPLRYRLSYRKAQ